VAELPGVEIELIARGPGMRTTSFTPAVYTGPKHRFKMEIPSKLSNQVFVAVVDCGQTDFLVAANIRQSPDAAFRLQLGLGQSNRVQLFNGTGNSKFLSFVRARLRSDIVISVQGQGTWKLSGCWPSHYKGPDLGSTSSDVAIEALEISPESIALYK
jgi:hypothetical protein